MTQLLNNNSTGQKLWLFVHPHRKTSVLKKCGLFLSSEVKNLYRGKVPLDYLQVSSLSPLSHLLKSFGFPPPPNGEWKKKKNQPGSLPAWWCSMSRLRIGKLHIVQASQYWWLLAKPVDLCVLLHFASWQSPPVSSAGVQVSAWEQERGRKHKAQI